MTLHYSKMWKILTIRNEYMSEHLPAWYFVVETQQFFKSIVNVAFQDTLNAIYLLKNKN